MRRTFTLLLTALALFALLVSPAVAQDDPSAEPPASPSAAPASGVGGSSPPEATVPPLPTPIPAGDGPVVQGVFYFSPTCGHCHYVITEVLPVIYAENGGAWVITVDENAASLDPAFYLMNNGHIQLLMVDVSQPDGQLMYLDDSEALGFDAPPGVPLLHIGDEWYLGSGDIPAELPGIVEAGLAGEGIAWPPTPGLAAAIEPFLRDGSVAAAAPDEDDDSGDAAVLPVGGGDLPLDRLGRDPLGNGVAIVVLIILIGTLLGAPWLATRESLPSFPSWLVPLLALAGLVVAAYLATIETSGTEAVCGPVGDCNTVQQSQYAELAGIPIGVLGVIGYVLIGGLWLVSRVAHGAAADWALVLMATGAFIGTLFSAYLTFLEPFVIGATCMWCISSALIMLALLWVTAGPGWAAWRRLRHGSGGTHSAAPARS